MILLDLSEAKRAAMAQGAEQPATVKVDAALVPSVFTLGGADGEDSRYKRITAANSKRDLNPMMHYRMQEICFFLATTIGFAKRFVELMTDYTVGAKGFHIQAQEPAVQEVIDRFANDSINKLAAMIPELCAEQVKLGETCMRAVVNPVDGFVRWGYVEPQDIECIEYGALTGIDGEVPITFPIAVQLRAKAWEAKGERLEIIRVDEDPASPTFGKLTGQCWYVPINKSKSASRGISDIFAFADWIDVLDQIVFDGADRVRFLNQFLWHYILKGADDGTVKKFEGEIRKQPPRQGGFHVTNDQVEIKPVSPDLKSYEFANTIGSLKSYGLAGMGFPNHWFADPGDVNLATAKEMGEPTLKKLEARQAILVGFVADVINFVLDQAQLAGTLPEGIDRTFEIQAPQLSKKDLGKGATTMQSVGNSLSLGEDRGWITSETAAKAFHKVLQEIDVDVDPDEFEKAQREMEERRADDANALNPQSKLADALKQLPQPAEEVVQ